MPHIDLMADRDPVRIYCEQSGEGEAVVLLHGNFTDCRIWDNAMAKLSKSNRVIRYDQRGYGQSDAPKGPFAPVQDLLELMDRLGISRAAFVGSSSGGALALDFALLHPERTSALVLAAPSVSGNGLPVRMLLKGMQNYRRARKLGTAAAIEHFANDPYWSYFFPPPDKTDARDHVLANVRKPGNFCRFPPQYAKAPRPPAWKRLRELTAPALIVVGDQDHTFNVSTARKLHGKLPDSELAVMKGCGHLPYVEEPDEFVQLALRFLRQQGGRAPS